MARELCSTVPTVEQLLKLMDIQKKYERRRANQARAGMKWYRKNRESLLPKGREYMRRRRAGNTRKKGLPRRWSNCLSDLWGIECAFKRTYEP